MAELKTIITLRQGTTAEWATSSVILKPGEMGLEYLADGSVKIKAGDDEHLWADLPYVGSDVKAANVFQVELAEGEVDDIVAIEEQVAAEGATKQSGDVAIVKATIANGKHSYTSYVYDPELDVEGEGSSHGWSAMDGNYSANNVYFKDDLITSFAMGNITLSNGAATIPAAGKNLQQVWESIYLKEINTGLKSTAPSCSMSGTEIKYYEVGAQSADQTVTLGLNKGSYAYGYGYVSSKDETDPAEGTKAVTVVTNDGTGVVAKATKPYALTCDGTAIDPTTTDGNVFICPGTIKETAPAQVKCSGTVSYENAGNPVSNLGNIYAGQAYADATSSAAEKTLSRWYYPMYKGFTYSDGSAGTAVVTDHAHITGARVQQFGKVVDKEAYEKTKFYTATASKAWRQYFYAFPKDYEWTMSGAKDGNNIDCTVLQAEDVTLTFNGVDVVYSVFYINNAADYGTLKITWTI